ncbi:hypothetical protein Tco_1567428 [Tanacetum coccineum]
MFLCLIPLCIYVLSAFKAKVNTEKLSDDSDSQGGGNEDEDEELNLITRNFQEFFRKGHRFVYGNQFGNGSNRFGRGHGNGFRNKGAGSSRRKCGRYNYGEEGHFIGKCIKPKKSKVFVGGA